MSYQVAIDKSWDELIRLKPKGNLSIKFFADEYSVNIEGRRVLSLSCNAPVKDFIAILILHYLTSKLKGLPSLTNEWMNFKELSGVEGYLSAFRRRAIEPIIRKYGHKPEGLLEALDRLPGKRVNQGDIGIVLDVFEQVPVLVSFWRADEEFGPEANMLFDRSITKIFCTEDIVVFGGFVAASL